MATVSNSARERNLTNENQNQPTDSDRSVSCKALAQVCAFGSPSNPLDAGFAIP